MKTITIELTQDEAEQTNSALDTRARELGSHTQDVIKKNTASPAIKEMYINAQVNSEKAARKVRDALRKQS